ncbi:MAG: DUF5615 family PIN-like protein [Caldilineales bacterium]|nr:DUF5615 family PIN-like protein [Caldilineales bacterium]
MSVGLYMDEHVPRAIMNGLRLRGIDVLTAQEDGMAGQPDAALLDRATELRRVIFTQDDDFLAEAHKRQDIAFAGIVYTHQLRLGIGAIISDLALIAAVAEYEEMVGRVEFLPLGG